MHQVLQGRTRRRILQYTPPSPRTDRRSRDKNSVFPHPTLLCTNSAAWLQRVAARSPTAHRARFLPTPAPTYRLSERSGFVVVSIARERVRVYLSISVQLIPAACCPRTHVRPASEEHSTCPLHKHRIHFMVQTGLRQTECLCPADAPPLRLLSGRQPVKSVGYANLYDFPRSVFRPRSESA